MALRESVKQTYVGRECLIILGLTGRTGSGCSTVAEILKNFSSNNLHNPALIFPITSFQNISKYPNSLAKQGISPQKGVN